MVSQLYRKAMETPLRASLTHYDHAAFGGFIVDPVDGDPAQQRMPAEAGGVFMYEHHRDVPQMTLPFEEFRFVCRDEIRHLEATGWPAWDKDAAGKPIAHPRNTALPPEFFRGLLESATKGRIAIRSRDIVVERAEDLAAVASILDA